MKIEDLTQALDRYGGDVGRWPRELRTAAEALAANDERAARILAEGQQLDSLLLAAVKPAPLNSALIGRIVSGLDNGAHESATIRPTPRFAAWVGAAMIAFLSSGYAAGMALPASSGEDTFAGLMFGGDLIAEDTNGWSQL